MMFDLSPMPRLSHIFMPLIFPFFSFFFFIFSACLSFSSIFFAPLFSPLPPPPCLLLHAFLLRLIFFPSIFDLGIFRRLLRLISRHYILSFFIYQGDAQPCRRRLPHLYAACLSLFSFLAMPFPARLPCLPATFSAFL